MIHLLDFLQNCDFFRKPYLWLGGGNESAGSDKISAYVHIFFNISRFEMRYKVDIDNQTKIDNTPWWMNYQKGNLYFNQK